MPAELPLIQPPAVACSLDADGLARRGDEFRSLFAGALTAVEPLDGGARFRLEGDDATEAAVRALVRKESECCPFFDFRVARDEHVVLDVRAPHDAAPLVDALVALARAAGRA